mmetsp:Transcript_9705/g.26880  ORF Transcript_9705/g.26880 Transcript_9705/m.26880 type:complete len:102 (-) Transcript_9705:3266-3571(-)
MRSDTNPIAAPPVKIGHTVVGAFVPDQSGTLRFKANVTQIQYRVSLASRSVPHDHDMVDRRPHFTVSMEGHDQHCSAHTPLAILANVITTHHGEVVAIYHN